MKIIKDQVEWYYKNSEKANIPTLLTFQDKLSGNFYFYTEKYYEAMKEYTGEYGEYKTMYSKLFLENVAKKITTGITNKEAEEIAKVGSMTKWTQQMFSQAEIERMKVEIRAIEKILSAIQQRISYLKQESTNKI